MTRSARRSEYGVIRPRTTTVKARRPRGPVLARAVGALGMVVLTALLFWLLTDPSFRITSASVSFEGLVHADERAVRSHLAGIDRGPNVFRVRAADIVKDVSTLPDVDAASASVVLPAGISVRLEERAPLFVWSNGDESWLVDEDGMLFGPTGRDLGPSASQSGAGVSDGDDAGVPDPDADIDAVAIEDDPRAGLPVVDDARIADSAPTVGSHLAATDLIVMRQLLALTPELLGSRSEELELRVDQHLGYELRSDLGWQAVFGHYFPLVQPPTVIPRQVQCLQAVLAREERKLQRVRLAVSDDGCGTFIVRD